MYRSGRRGMWPRYRLRNAGQEVWHEEAPKEASRRYSPAECTGAEKRRISGTPDVKHVSTSYVERANLTMQMDMRRFTRPTNAFSKKLDNPMAAMSLRFMH